MSLALEIFGMSDIRPIREHSKTSSSLNAPAPPSRSPLSRQPEHELPTSRSALLPQQADSGALITQNTGWYGGFGLERDYPCDLLSEYESLSPKSSSHSALRQHVHTPGWDSAAHRRPMELFSGHSVGSWRRRWSVAGGDRLHTVGLTSFSTQCYPELSWSPYKHITSVYLFQNKRRPCFICLFFNWNTFNKSYIFAFGSFQNFEDNSCPTHKTSNDPYSLQIIYFHLNFFSF